MFFTGSLFYFPPFFPPFVVRLFILSMADFLWSMVMNLLMFEPVALELLAFSCLYGLVYVGQI